VGGGVELGRAAEEITMLDIFRAMGEPASMSLCTRGQVCQRNAFCPTHAGVWHGLDVAIEEYLARATLAESVELGNKLRAQA
jgi:DNA-binding IscR family transcriptional regulator